jgi:hypothetical protein
VSRYSRLPACLAFLILAPSPDVVSARGEIPKDARDALEKADQIELLSINPKLPKEKPKDSFQGYEVRGRKLLKDKQDRQKLVEAFEKGAKDNKGVSDRCFNPRHGLRVTHNKKTVEFLICFECLQVQVYVDGKRKEADDFLVTKSPQRTFDQFLKADK